MLCFDQKSMIGRLPGGYGADSCIGLQRAAGLQESGLFTGRCKKIILKEKRHGKTYQQTGIAAGGSGEI